MKKIFILVLVTLILTGCETTKQAEITPPGVEEIQVEEIQVEKIEVENVVTTWDTAEEFITTWDGF